MSYVLYQYTPSKIAAICAAGLFGASTIYHLTTLIQKKTRFYIAMTVGGLSKSQSKCLLFSYSLVLTIISSDDCWLHLPIPLRKRYYVHHVLFGSISLHHSPTFSLRSNDLYDLRPYRLIRQCTICIHHKSQIRY